jgi:transcriptional regulator with XRE-family HTH domain
VNRPVELQLASAVRAARLTAGLTVERAAERCELDVRHIQAIEAGGANVTLRTLARLEAGLALGILRLEWAGESKLAESNTTTYAADRWQVVGANVSRRRLERGLSQAQLADAAHLSVSLVQSVELAAKAPTLRSVYAIAAALKVDARDLLAPGISESPKGTRPRIRRR